MGGGFECASSSAPLKAVPVGASRPAFGHVAATCRRKGWSMRSRASNRLPVQETLTGASGAKTRPNAAVAVCATSRAAMVQISSATESPSRAASATSRANLATSPAGLGEL
jgi:hypothetical protein